MLLLVDKKSDVNISPKLELGCLDTAYFAKLKNYY